MPESEHNFVFGSNDQFGIDVGFGKPIELSSIFKEVVNPHYLLPANSPGDYSLHTEFELNPHVIVDLQSVRVVKRIRVFNREAWSDRAVPLVASMSLDKETWTEICRINYVFGGRRTGTPLDISFRDDHPRLRYLKLEVQKQTYLQLDYIEILSPAPKLGLGRIYKVDALGPDILAEYHHHNSFGFTWTLTLTLGAVMWCQSYGIVITRIDFSRCLAQFKDRPGLDLYSVLFIPPSITGKVDGLLPAQFTQHGIYTQLDLEKLNVYARTYFMPSSDITSLESELVRRHSLQRENAIALVYRGTDKHKEVPPAPIERYISVALAARRMNPTLQVIIQTDQEQALQAVLNAIPDAIYFKELPVTSGTKVIHELELENEFAIQKTEFSIRMLAVIHLLSTMKYVVSHTGNIGFWLAIYRGKRDGFYQFDENTDLRGPDSQIISDIDDEVMLFADVQ